MNEPLHLAAILCLIFISGFFSLSETALFSLSRLQISRIRRRSQVMGSLVSSLIQRPRRTLISLLIGNNLVNVMATALATAWAVSVLGKGGVSLAILLVTLVILIIGEIIPKVLAVGHAEKLAPAIAWPLNLFAKTTYPIRKILTFVTDPILGNYLKQMATQEDITNQEELRAIISFSTHDGTVSKQRRDMIDTIFEFGERPVKEIMTPRLDLVTCRIDSSYQDLINLMKESRKSKILIYRERMDQMVGYVATRNLLLGRERDFRKLIRPLYFIPETKRIDDLLTEFETKGLELAVVVDEYGGTAGVVTREDIVEEIVGELYDEHESTENLIQKRGNDYYLINGKVSVREVNEQLGLGLPTDEHVETIAGLFLSLYGHIPKEGASVRVGNYKLKVERLIGRRIATVILEGGK
jgi:putative hemolysin